MEQQVLTLGLMQKVNTFLCSEPSNVVSRLALHPTNKFLMVELDQIMRQRDQQFAQLLCRVRKAECTEDDLDMLRSRHLEDSDPEYPALSQVKGLIFTSSRNSHVKKWCFVKGLSSLLGVSSFSRSAD